PAGTRFVLGTTADGARFPAARGADRSLALSLHAQIVLHVVASELLGHVFDEVLGVPAVDASVEGHAAVLHADRHFARIDARILAQPLADHFLQTIVAALVTLRTLAAMLARTVAVRTAPLRALAPRGVLPVLPLPGAVVAFDAMTAPRARALRLAVSARR